MPIPTIATGIASVHQKSGEFLLKVELSRLVVVFIGFSFSPSLERRIALHTNQIIIIKSSNTISDARRFEKFPLIVWAHISSSGAIIPINGSTGGVQSDYGTKTA